MLPLFPPVIWWRHYVRRRLEGLPEPEAVSRANEESVLAPRGWMRLEVAGGATLSLPVAGGASMLKNHPAGEWRFAPQAPRQWRRHKATLATAYGKAPFFLPVMDLLSSLDKQFDSDCAVFNMQAFRAVGAFLNLEELLPAFGSLFADDRQRLEAVAREWSAAVEPRLSVVDALMRLGPDTFFALL